MNNKITVLSGVVDKIVAQTLWEHPIEIIHQLAHIWRKEIYPKYEPGGSGAAWVEVRMLLREWIGAVWWCAKRIFLAWILLLGLLVTLAMFTPSAPKGSLDTITDLPRVQEPSNIFSDLQLDLPLRDKK